MKKKLVFRWMSESVGTNWKNITKELGLRKCSRSTEINPVWSVIGGKGFSIYVSEIRLADSKKKPPAWELSVESLSLLPPEGEEAWGLVIETIESYLKESFEKYKLYKETDGE